MPGTVNPQTATTQRLASTLATVGLHGCSSVEELLKFDGGGDKRNVPTAAYLVAPRIRVQAHHDIEPAMLVYDPYLGTIGLVEVLAGGDTGDYQREFDRLIERTAYLRQLSLLAAEPRRQRALTVELVIVMPREHAVGAGLSVSEILRQVARETGYLEAIGVSLLYESANGGFATTDVQRAFAWLLAATRRWFADVAPHGEAAAPNGWQLLLDNYRHQGRRTFTFVDDATLHVVHGYNGTGKTSFTEALELLLTGRVDRLEAAGQKFYFPVVRFRGAQLLQASGSPAVVTDDTDAAVELLVGQTRLVKVTVSKVAEDGDSLDRTRTGADTEPPPLLSAAASFRLDQPTMDGLVRNSDAERASLFLRAFFPTEGRLFRHVDASRGRMQAAFAKLPPSLREPTGTTEDPRQAVRTRLAWTRTAVEQWTADTLTAALNACLPLSIAQLEILAHQRPALGDAVRGVKTAPATLGTFEAALKSVDSALQALSPDPATMLRHLDVAIGVLQEFNQWTAAGRVNRGESFAAALNEWLELTALADLAGKELELRATLAAARQRGWAPGSNAPAFMSDPVDAQSVEGLRHQRDDLLRACETARAAVHRWTDAAAHGEAASAATAAGGPPRTSLLPKEIESLNAAGAWLPSVPPDRPEKLGHMFAAAIADDQMRTFGGVVIGSAGGLTTAIAQATELRAACERLVAPHDGAAAMLGNCRTAIRAIDWVGAWERRVENAFLDEIARAGKRGHLLNEALNELLALFKPAPWAYADVSLQAGHRGQGRDREELGLRTADNSKADLRLNTAELNAFTLALFLLCAPRLTNPLRALVLDDPMQNMDELTVSAIARGLAKLMPIFPAGWQIVALFHAEDDVRRVRDEVPCAVYRLPWLAPAATAAERVIGYEEQESTWKYGLQTLAELQAAEIPVISA